MTTIAGTVASPTENRTFEIIVPQDQRKVRLDQFLTLRIERLSRSQLQKLIKDGNIRVNDKAVKPSHQVMAGEQIVVTLPPKKKYELHAEDIPLTIIYEDASLIIINKPAGMVVHPAYANLSGTLVNALLKHCENLSTLSGQQRPGLVHRLDKDTSGLLVVAKNDYVHEKLAKQFSSRTIHREYRALVWGHFNQKTGRIESLLNRSSQDRTRMVISKSGKPAITNYAVIDEYPLISLLRVKLETGRTHQIRVHLSAKGHPVLGDQVYGGRHKQVIKLNQKYQHLALELLRIMPRQALHAKTLGFIHPETGKEMIFDSDLPDDIQNTIDFLERLKKL
ncbi:RluA family pseudouridine synthase [candidate division KSB1 bacterium]|nr:RluA family pseudouridine synthase [candidate division KSB1 bacterium]